MDNIGERLKEERQLRGWSQRDLARETGVNTDTISGIETGQHEPRPSTLRKLAEGLGIEVRDFFMEPALPKAPAREAGQPKEEETTAQAAVPPSEEDETVIHLESADDIGAKINDILWNLPESRGRRLVVDIREDNSAEVRLMPAGTATERKKQAR